MRYFCVTGGDMFSFRIPKITTRDMRLLERYAAQKDSFLFDAERNLRAVQSKCEYLAKVFGVSYSTVICLRSHVANVSIFLPLWDLGREEWALLQRLRPCLAGITVYPFRFGLKIIFKIKYFGDETICVEKDLGEILQNYVKKQKAPFRGLFSYR